MPINRNDFSIATVNGIVYVIGGEYIYQNGSSQYLSQITNATEAFNPQTNTWSEKAPTLVPVMGSAAAACNGKIYVFGGYAYPPGNQTSEPMQQTNLTQVYDPSTDTWSLKAQIPVPLARLTANEVGGKIYILGGQVEQTSQSDPKEIIGYTNNQTLVYDPDLDSWTSKTPMPMPLPPFSSAMSAVIGNKICVIPEDNGNGPFAQNNLTQIYDTKTDRWSNGSAIPVLLQGPAACATSGVYAPQAIYVFGGFFTSTASHGFGMNPPKGVWQGSMVEVYFPLNDSWGLGANMPTPRAGAGVANINDTFYVVGGITFSMGADGRITSFMPQEVTEAYTPYSFQDIKPPSMIPTLILYSSVGAALACLSGAVIFLVVKRRPTLRLWAAKSAVAMRALSKSAKWILLCVFCAWAAFFVNGFLSATSLHWKIPLTNFVSIDFYGAIIPTAVAAIFVIFCLGYLRFSVRRYLEFLLFAIVLAISLTQVVHDSLNSASVTSPILLICGFDGILGFILAFMNSQDPLAAGAGFMQRIQFGWKQFAAALLATSSCAALSALFVDVIIARYLGIFSVGPVFTDYVGGLGSADGILAYLILALFVVTVVTTAALAVSTAIRSDRGKPQQANEEGLTQKQ